MVVKQVIFIAMQWVEGDQMTTWVFQIKNLRFLFLNFKMIKNFIRIFFFIFLNFISLPCNKWRVTRRPDEFFIQNIKDFIFKFLNKKKFIKIFLKKLSIWSPTHKNTKLNSKASPKPRDKNKRKKISEPKIAFFFAEIYLDRS